jgi:hypothetical protein
MFSKASFGEYLSSFLKKTVGSRVGKFDIAISFKIREKVYTFKDENYLSKVS